MFFKADFTTVVRGLWFVTLRRHSTELGTSSGDTVSSEAPSVQIL